MAGAEEYVAYNESSPGFLLPIIAIQRANGTSSFRDMTREDLSRIPDDFSSPGGWIFKKSNTSNTWSRRFALLRGAFMFYFRSPQAERPVGIIPLTDCEVGLPSDPQAASTEGFEFEIRNFLGSLGWREGLMDNCLPGAHRLLPLGGSTLGGVSPSRPRPGCQHL